MTLRTSPHRRPRPAARLLVWLLLLCLPWQGAALAIERAGGPAHVHVKAGAEIVDQGLHVLRGQAARLLGWIAAERRPMLVHASARVHAHELAHEHAHRHAGGVGHHHHDAYEPGVLPVADDDSDGTAQRVAIDVPALAVVDIEAGPIAMASPSPDAAAVRFRSCSSEPLERPPRTIRG